MDMTSCLSPLQSASDQPIRVEGRIKLISLLGDLHFRVSFWISRYPPLKDLFRNVIHRLTHRGSISAPITKYTNPFLTSSPTCAIRVRQCDKRNCKRPYRLKWHAEDRQAWTFWQLVDTSTNVATMRHTAVKLIFCSWHDVCYWFLSLSTNNRVAKKRTVITAKGFI